jgi:hypothetical protein
MLVGFAGLAWLFRCFVCLLAPCWLLSVDCWIVGCCDFVIACEEGYHYIIHYCIVRNPRESVITVSSVSGFYLLSICLLLYHLFC